jgi:hypothetical protein
LIENFVGMDDRSEDKNREGEQSECAAHGKSSLVLAVRRFSLLQSGPRRAED